MNFCERLEDDITNDGYIIKNAPLRSSDGRCCGRKIAIRKDLPSLRRRADALAEEWAHGKLTVGDIRDQTNINNRKQERKARLYAYNMRLCLLDIVNAYKGHCTCIYEMSEYLDVAEETILDALEYYKQIYGYGTLIGDYYIQFEPSLQVYDYFSI